MDKVKQDLPRQVHWALQEIINSASEVLQESVGMDKKDADLVGYYIAKRFSEYCGGLQFYVPKKDIFSRVERDEAILREFKEGSDANQIARRHKISVFQVYRIIKRMQKQCLTQNKIS